MRLPFLWIRLWSGKRLGIVPDKREPPLFSERYGYTKVWRALGYRFILREKEGVQGRYWDRSPLIFFGWSEPRR